MLREYSINNSWDITCYSTTFQFIIFHVKFPRILKLLEPWKCDRLDMTYPSIFMFDAFFFSRSLLLFLSWYVSHSLSILSICNWLFKFKEMRNEKKKGKILITIYLHITKKWHWTDTTLILMKLCISITNTMLRYRRTIAFI